MLIRLCKAETSSAGFRLNEAVLICNYLDLIANKAVRGCALPVASSYHQKSMV